MTLEEILHPQNVETLWYPAADGSPHRILFCRPKDSLPSQKLPVFFWIHGGGWQREGPERMLPHIQYFSGCGMAAFSVEYRLSTADGPQVEDCLRDCAAALQYLYERRENLGLDFSYLALGGDSAGGHLACCLSCPQLLEKFHLHIPPAACVINCNGVIDLTMKWKEALFLPPWHSPEEWLAQYQRARNISPIFHITAETSPTMVLHGLADDIVEPEEGARYTAALKAQGVPVQLQLYPTLGHAFILFDYAVENKTVFSILHQILFYLYQQSFPIITDDIEHP